jgi:hypothetical protein
LVRRMTPSQYNSYVRQLQSRFNQAVRSYNQEVDRVNRANKAAADKFVRDYNHEVDRVNQHNRRVVEDHNRRVRQRNQNAQAAVAKYNQTVRSHNAKVERDRQRRVSALKAASSSRYAQVRTSTIELSDHFERVERSGSTSTFPDLLALSEKEAANSALVAEAFTADEPDVATTPEDTGILEYLAGFSQDLCDRWRGAMFSLNPANPDAARHFCTSVREIFTEILDRWADNNEVLEADPNCELTPNKSGPTRRAKIRYLLRRKKADTPEMLGFVEKDIDDILQLFHVFNEATHGSAGRHGFEKLRSIKQRVEGGIMFLAAIAL